MSASSPISFGVHLGGLLFSRYYLTLSMQQRPQYLGDEKKETSEHWLGTAVSRCITGVCGMVPILILGNLGTLGNQYPYSPYCTETTWKIYLRKQKKLTNVLNTVLHQFSLFPANYVSFSQAVSVKLTPTAQLGSLLLPLSTLVMGWLCQCMHWTLSQVSKSVATMCLNLLHEHRPSGLNNI